MKEGKRPMDIDLSNEINIQTPSSNERHLVARPVAGGSSGEGLPYAPEDWPLPGDKWRWKVGNRRSASGHWVDRYLYPPLRLQSSGKGGFPSKLSVRTFVQKEFPDMDIDAFFASFVWKVPCAEHIPGKDAESKAQSFTSPRRSDAKEHSGSGLTSGVEGCKAGNKMCSLHAKARNSGLTTMDCDICCSEAGFCRDCCCILCCKIIDWIYGGYSFIRCEAKVGGNCMCGHVAHLDCALKCYMAGTVVGSIGLDVEYYCRRCDNKTDLISHVTKLIKTCESPCSQADAEKILKLGLCILRGSEQARAKNLRNRIESIKSKLKVGAHLNNISKADENISAIPAGEAFENGNEIKILGTRDTPIYDKGVDFGTEVEPLRGNDAADGRAQSSVYIASDHGSVSMKLEDEVDKALQELKNSQELEYRIAEQKLYALKDILLSLYQQLDAERSELGNPTSLVNGSDSDALLSNVLNRVDQIKHEEVKLKDMMKIARGFARTPKSILNELFGLPSDD